MEKPVTRVVAGFLHVARGIEHMREGNSAVSGDRLSITLGPFTIRGLTARALHELDRDKRLHLGLLAA